tara:strand:- start:469 stop:1332 length:864 start_codon:yes stop_codon:yes gene_type:complete
MKIAVCFFGITRSLSYTIDSIYDNILKVLTKEEIDFDIYLHTYNVSTYYNKRAKEKSDNMDNEEYKLLNADYLKIDDDTEIRREIDIEKYKTHHDPFKNNYNSVFNFILACYSRYQIVEMIKESEKEYDYIMYVRPDCYYPNPLNVDFLEKVSDKEIVVSNFHLTKEQNVRNGFNDRFAICNKNTYEVYGNVYLDLHKISKKRPLHSEKVLLVNLKSKNIGWVNVNFHFSRVRINGKICDLDLHFMGYDSKKNIKIEKCNIEKYLIKKISPDINNVSCKISTEEIID